MKIILILVFLLSGCSTFKAPSKRETPSGKVSKSLPDYSPPKGVWELLNQKSVALHFQNVDTGAKVTVNLRNGLTMKALPSGHWVLERFSLQGKNYRSMNTSKKFVFRMQDKAHIYAGSLLIGCPKNSTNSLKDLKGMAFFNRYPFSSSKQLCELIVGNNLSAVASRLKKAKKNKDLNLTIGF